MVLNTVECGNPEKGGVQGRFVDKICPRCICIHIFLLVILTRFFYEQIYIYTQDTESKPSHLGIVLIMKDKRSKIKTNEQMIQKMMMLQYRISIYIWYMYYIY